MLVLPHHSTMNDFSTLNALIEIPKGSQNKYEYDHENHQLKLDRVLFSPLHYPGDYGFVPDTLAEDGDPLDVLVLVTYPTYPGTMIESRPLGMLDMIDGGDPDYKVLCVPTCDPRYNHYQSLKDVPEPTLNEIAHFFSVYKHLEGKEVKIGDWHDMDETRKVIEKSFAAYGQS